jgi:hypothetical protein
MSTKKQVKKTVTVPQKKNQPVPDDKVLREKTYKYAVEKGVMITTMRQTFSQMQFPFALMNVGDSFLIPVKDPGSKNPNTLHYAAKMYARYKPGFSITTRLQLDGCRRVWRIK